MRIVHIEDFFLPTAGYQINVLSKYLVKNGNEVYICTSSIDRTPKHLTSFFGSEGIEEADRQFESRFGVKILRFDIFRAYSGRAIYKPSFFREVGKLKPDILFVHGNDSFAGLVYTAQCASLPFPIVFDNHMLEMATQNRLNRYFRWFYRKFFAPRIIKHNLRVIRVVDDSFVLKHLGVPADLSPVLPLGTDTLNFFPDLTSRREFRNELGISEEAFVYVYAGKLDETKGGHFLASALLKRLSTDAGRELVFLIVGTIRGMYGEDFERIISRSENRILRFPTQNYLDLPRFYQVADAAIYPKQCSLSFYDAQACGLPVVVEDNSINCARVTSNNGFVFKSGDMDDFRSKLVYAASLSENDLEPYKIGALEYIRQSDLNYEKITEEYESLFVKVRDEFLRSRD